MAESAKITKTSIIVIILTILSQLVVFLRDIIIAKKFGTGMETDSFFLIFVYPSLAVVLVDGFIFASFIPNFIKRFFTDKKNAWEMSSSFFNILLIIFAGITALFMIFPEYFIRTTAPGLSTESISVSVKLGYIIFPLFLLNVFLSIFGAINISFGRQITVVCANTIMSISVLVLMVILFFTGFGIEGLAIAFITGTVIRILVNMVMMVRGEWQYSPLINLKNEGVKELLKNILPVSIGIFCTDGYILFERAYASGLSVGSIASLGFASRLMLVPILSFTYPITRVIYREISEYWTKNSKEEVKRVAALSFRLTLFTVLPASIFLFSFSHPVVETFFQRGQFNENSTEIVSNALKYFSIGIVPSSLATLAALISYAILDLWMPTKVGIASMASYIIMVHFLSKHFGVNGIALALSIMSILKMLIIYPILVRKTGNFLGGDTIRFIWKLIVSGILLFLLNSALFEFTKHYFIGANFVIKLSLLMIYFVVDCILFLLFCFLLRLKEVRTFWEVLKGKIALTLKQANP